MKLTDIQVGDSSFIFVTVSTMVTLQYLPVLSHPMEKKPVQVICFGKPKCISRKTI